MKIYNMKRKKKIINEMNKSNINKNIMEEIKLIVNLFFYSDSIIYFHNLFSQIYYEFEIEI